jgi:acetyl esterase/lipase
MCSPELLRGMAGHYLGAAGDATSPLVSPVHGDLADLPPMLIQVGSDEVLLDDARTLAKRAEEAGVDVTLEVWDDAIHVFQAMAGVPEAEEAMAGIGEFVRKHTAWG